MFIFAKHLPLYDRYRFSHYYSKMTWWTRAVITPRQKPDLKRWAFFISQISLFCYICAVICNKMLYLSFHE